MRNDVHPFTNKYVRQYVRQAIAYTLDRPAIVQALFHRSLIPPSPTAKTCVRRSS